MELVSGAGVNGAVVHCLLLARELARRSHRITVVCRPGAWIASQLGGEPVDVVESDLSRWPPTELKRLAAFAAGYRVDVLHTHMSRAHFFGVLLRRLSGIPCVASAHSQHFQLHWMLNDRVIAVSEATRRYHRRVNFVAAKRIAVVHNFVDHQRLASVPAATRARVRAMLGIGEAVPLIGAFGDIIPRKGWRYLLRALARVQAVVPQAHLLLAGAATDAQVAQLASASQELKVAAAVTYAGLRLDIPDLLGGLDVFASASLAEDFPLSILEAMAAGVPVVATTVGGIPECISSGETGLLVAPGDAKALGDGLTTLLRDADLRMRLGAAAAQRVHERFSPETQVPKIEAELARAVADRARRSQTKRMENRKQETGN